MLPGWKSALRAGFWPDCYRKSTDIGLKGPGNLTKNPAPKPDEAKPKITGALPANRRNPIPIDFGPVSGCFDHDPKLFNCEIPVFAKSHRTLEIHRV